MTMKGSPNGQVDATVDLAPSPQNSRASTGGMTMHGTYYGGGGLTLSPDSSQRLPPGQQVLSLSGRVNSDQQRYAGSVPECQNQLFVVKKVSNAPVAQTVQPAEPSPAPQQSASSAAPRSEATASRVAAAPAAAPTEGGVKPVPGSRKWDSLDIVGLKTGITPDEFQQHLKKSEIPLRIDVVEAELIDMPNTRHISHIVGRANKEIEILLASFAPVPNKSVAGVVGRHRGYPDGQKPTIQNVRAALVDKYGPPSFQREGNDNFHFLIWAFDRDGNQVAGAMAEQCENVLQFVGDVKRIPNNSLFYESFVKWAKACPRALVVSILDFQKKDFVDRIGSVLVDLSMMDESLARTASMVTEYRRKQQEKELEQAQKQGKPKL